jgi:hypothetical protein
MNTVQHHHLWAITIGAFLIAACATPARDAAVIPGHTPPPLSRDKLERLIDKSLPPIIGQNNSDLVAKLLKATIGKPMSQTFDRDKAVRELFGGEVPRFAPNCQNHNTPVGEPDQGECVAELGDAIGTGDYSRLAHSKNLGLGDITFLKRSVVQERRPKDLTPVKISDKEAFERAQSSLHSAFGLDLAEIPKPPPDAKVLPVSSLTSGFGSKDQADRIPPLAVQKVVRLQRGLAVEGIGDPQSGRMLPYIPAPGVATVTLDDSGVAAIIVENWQELRLDPLMDARKAKTRAELIHEIAEDLASEEIHDLERLSFLLVVSSDWRGTYGYLVPALRLFVSPVPRDLTQEQQRALKGKSTAGFVREYPLVNRTQAELQRR